MKSDEYNLKNIIGSAIADMRKCAGFTQEEFAKMFNISSSSMSHYEQGTNQMPLDLIVAICDYFHVSVDYIVGRSHNKDEYKDRKEKICADLTSDDIKNLCSHIPLKNQYVIKEIIYALSEK